VNKSISLYMPVESIKDGNNPSASYEIEIHYVKYIRVHNARIMECWNNVEVSKKEVLDLESKCEDLNKVKTDLYNSSLRNRFNNYDYIYGIYNTEHKLMKRALCEADVKLSEAEKKYFEAEQSFYTAATSVCQKWITRLCAPEYKFKLCESQAADRLEKFKSDCITSFFNSRVIENDVYDDMLIRRRDLELYAVSCVKTEALVVDTPKSVAVTPVSVN